MASGAGNAQAQSFWEHNRSPVGNERRVGVRRVRFLGAKRERQSVGRCGQKGSDGVSEPA
jgi:hypothetical protein